MPTRRSPAACLLTALLLAAACSAPAAYAQDDPAQGDAPAPDTLLAPPWSLSLGGKLSAAQSAYSNWTEGGINTFAFTTGLSGAAEREGDLWVQTYEARLAFGLVKQDTLELRKADDVIRLAAALQYTGGGRFFDTFRPTLAAEARTQFAAGFNYDEVPGELERPGAAQEPPVQVAAFLAPGTFTETLGLTYDPADWFTQRLGLSSKQTLVRLRRLRALYGVDPESAVRLEAGLSSMTTVDREILENVRLTSTLGLFAAFNQIGEPDVTWENVLNMQVNRFLSVDLSTTVLYDRDVSEALQLKEVLSLGVTVVFI